MKKTVLLILDVGGQGDSSKISRFVASWNEREDVPYRDGALSTEAASAVEHRFVKSVQEFNCKHGAALKVIREEKVQFDPSDVLDSSWLRFNINGFAGAGARELATGVYEDSAPCSGCRFVATSRQVRPLVLSARELGRKDFMNTAHLEMVVSARARAFLEQFAPELVEFRPVEVQRSKGAARKAAGEVVQLLIKTIGGRFAPRAQLELGHPCGQCGRETSRTTGGAPFLVDPKLMPEADLFLLDEPLGSSSQTPSRFRFPILSQSLYRALRKSKLTGYYVEPVLVDPDSIP